MERFLVYSFIVAFFSDIVLRDMSISSLQPYFQSHSILVSGLYAGLSIVIPLFVLLHIQYYVFHVYVPRTNQELIRLLFLAFPFGFMVDKWIEYMKFFPRLERYYREIGSGVWGGSSFVFSIVVSYIWIQLKIC